MKILMINVVCGIRSTGRICTDLAMALEEKGHDVKIAYGREKVPENFQKYAVRVGTDFDIRCHGIKARLFDGAGFGSKNVTKKFVEWIKEYDPDVIHLHNVHGYYINVEVLFEYLRICGKKILWTLHDCWAFTGHSAYCDAVRCEKWMKGCYKCPQVREYPKSLIDRSRRNWVKKRNCFLKIPNLTIVTPSHWLSGLVKDSFLKEYSVEVINNGIDITQFMPLRNNFKKYFEIENKHILLGVATTWNDMKGYSDFVQLANILDESYKVVMVGLSDEQLKKIPNNIIGIKKTESTKELSQIYSAADAFLNLSYCENYPTVNLEARACGTPVITYETGGSPESAGDGAVIVKQGDMRGLVNEITKMKLEKANKIPIKEIDYQVTLEKYENLYLKWG